MIYVLTHAEMMAATDVASWHGFQDAKEKASGFAEVGGSPLSFYFEKEQVWEIVDLLDKKNSPRLSELQPYAVALENKRLDASIRSLLNRSV